MRNEFIGIYTVSFILSVIGFILDLNERLPNVFKNVFEIFTLSCFIFLILIIGYLPFKPLMVLGIKRLRKLTNSKTNEN